jgi:tRNA threonylcarbamoyladenosine modification (KEOPS) complex  Pcc1 subunit
MKKSEPWVAMITTSSEDSAALVASLACEDVECIVSESNMIQVIINGASASDLRAKYNSMMRSLRASSDALTVMGEVI